MRSVWLTSQNILLWRETEYAVHIRIKDFIIRENRVKSMEDTAYTYMVECTDGSLYTGWTNHLEERMKSHNKGKGAKYTKSRLPVRLVYYETFSTKKEAMQREYAIKQLARKDKLELIAGQSKEVRENCERIAQLK